MGFIDITGQRFGKLTAIKRLEEYEQGRPNQTYWLCKCDCGNEKITTLQTLRAGHCKSCGCLKQNEDDWTGKTFGSLKVIGRDPIKYKSPEGNVAVRWICECQNCGMIKSVIASNLRNGFSRSCGWCKTFPAFRSADGIMKLTKDNIYGQIKETDNGYEVYFLGEYIGTHKTYKSAWASRRLCELLLLSNNKETYNTIINKKDIKNIS